MSDNRRFLPDDHSGCGRQRHRQPQRRNRNTDIGCSVTPHEYSHAVHYSGPWSWRARRAVALRRRRREQAAPRPCHPRLAPACGGRTGTARSVRSGRPLQPLPPQTRRPLRCRSPLWPRLVSCRCRTDSCHRTCGRSCCPTLRWQLRPQQAALVVMRLVVATITTNSITICSSSTNNNNYNSSGCTNSSLLTRLAWTRPGAKESIWCAVQTISVR